MIVSMKPLRTVATLALAALVLAGCGRRGDPELPKLAAEQEAQRKDEAFPVRLPGEDRPKAPPPRPKGSFILDPLL